MTDHGIWSEGQSQVCSSFCFRILKGMSERGGMVQVGIPTKPLSLVIVLPARSRLDLLRMCVVGCEGSNSFPWGSGCCLLLFGWWSVFVSVECWCVV